MSTKNLFGSIINYGDTLPSSSTTPDGALFFKTGTSPGFYIFSYRDVSADPGNQLGSGWQLLISSGGIDAETLDGLDSTAFQLTSPTLNALAAFNSNGFLVQTATGSFTSRSITASGTGLTINSGDGVAGNPEVVLSIDTAMSAFTGPLAVSKGGTGSSSAAVQGGIAYGVSNTQLGTSAAGTATSGAGVNQVWQVLTSAGTSAPLWVNSTSLNVASAARLTTARNINGTAFDGTGNITITANTPNSITFASSGGATAGSSFNGSSALTVSYATVGAQQADASLNSLAGLATTGILVRNSSGDIITRSIAVSGNGLSMSNADGTGGNPTIQSDATSANTADTIVYRDASGNFSAGDITAARIIGSTDGTAAAPIFTFSGNTNTGIYSSGTNEVAISTGGTRRFHVDGSGNATLTGDFTYGRFLTSTDTDTRVRNNKLDGTGRIIIHASDNIDGAQSGYIGIYGTDAVHGTNAGDIVFTAGTGGTVRSVDNFEVTGTITASGNITAFSDRRLKENISTIQNALSKVAQLSGVTYTRKGTTQAGVGLIAQDVEKVVPQAVVSNEEGYLSVAYGNLVGLLVEAIKEQQEQITALQRRIDQLTD